MFILFYSSTLIVIVVSPKKSQRADDNNPSRLSSLTINMWFLPRCLSIDSLNSCFQQQKPRSNYDFCFCREGLKLFQPRWEAMLKRRGGEHSHATDRIPIESFDLSRSMTRDLIVFSNPEKVDEESLPKKAFRYHRQHYRPQFRRRLPKRYSDIVGPSSTKALLCHNDSVLREKHSVSRLPRRHSTKTSNEIFHYLRSPPPKARHLIPSFSIIKTPGTFENVLAHRMQAAMSSELMHSLDRNFVFGDRKLSHHHPRMPRSHSFNICTLSNNYNRKASQQSQYQILQRAQRRWQKETVSVSEISPDYGEENQEFILRKKTVNGVPSGNDESTDDCQHPQPTTIHELDEKSSARTDQGVSSLFVIPPTLVTPTSEELSSTSPPPTPPSLPNLNPEQKSSVTFRCRAIADGLSTDHKLISKDSEPVELNQRPGTECVVSFSCK